MEKIGLVIFIILSIICIVMICISGYYPSEVHPIGGWINSLLLSIGGVISLIK